MIASHLSSALFPWLVPLLVAQVDTAASTPATQAVQESPAVAAPVPVKPGASSAKVLIPDASLEMFDASVTPWGPGRRTSGEVYRSSAQLLGEGPLRLRGAHWSLGFGAQLFARADLRDNADFRVAAGDFTPNADHRARLTLRGSLFSRVGMVVEFQDVRAWGSERTTATTEPFTGLHQGYVDVRAAEWLDLRIGRQELCYGEDRLLGCLDWVQSARAFDGLFVRAKTGTAFTLDLFGFQVKNFGRQSRVLADGSTQAITNTGTYLYGVYSRLRPLPAFGLDLYALGYTDDPTSFDVGQRSPNNTLTFGGRATGTVVGLTLTGEGAFQAGRFNRQPIVAGGFAGRGLYKLKLFGEPYAMFEVVGATGDGDAGDGVYRNFNQLFPTAHAHLGYIDYVAWSNEVDLHGALGWRPYGVHLWVDLHHFRYWDPRGPWLNAAGALFLAADPLRSAPVMGNEVDVSITVPVTANLAVSGALTLFMPGGGAVRAPGSTVGKGQGTSTWGFLYLRSQI